MVLTGTHTLFYLFGLSFLMYLAWFASQAIEANMSKEPKERAIKVWGNRKFHLTLLFIIGLIIVFRPIKMQSQTDANKEAVRSSFDAPAIEDREVVKTSKFNYENTEREQAFEQGKAEFDSLTNEK